VATDPYRYFRIEARELVEGLSQGVLALEKGPREAELVPRLLRLAHTLKGAARVVKQLEIADCAHQMEELLAPLRDPAEPLPAAKTPALLALVDRIEGLVKALSPEPIPSSSPEVAVAPAVVPDDSFQTVRIDVEEMDELLRAVTETGVQVAALKRELLDLRRLAGLSATLARRLSLRGGAETRNGDTTELGIALELQTGFERIVLTLSDRAERVEQELDDVRRGADRLRLIPVQTLSASLARAVRDAAQTLGKEARFDLDGGALRLDAQMLGPLRDAFLHLVRNAVAHGIEPPSERLTAKKPKTGTVRVTVTQRGPDVVFTCSDDGRGIDELAVRRALVGRGVIGENEHLSRAELLSRLLSGGVSTSAEVTQISGRGIGLDVLRETTTKLKAQISITSELGSGTQISLRLPLSLASLRALLLEASGMTVALPLDCVMESRRLAPGDFRRSVQGDSVVVGENILPFLPLARVLHRDETTNQHAMISVVIVRAGDRVAAIGVDGLMGTFDIVVRPLPKSIEFDPIVAHVSLDSEGSPRLVLDPGELVRLALRDRPSTIAPPAVQLPILVIDDSLTTRMLEQSILESAGYAVDLAVSAEQGLEKARQKAYGVILVDVEMPGMDGFEFVTLTRADPDLRNVPAILITSRNDPADFERGRVAGASDYIVKGDFDQKRLLATIERLMVR
jgi:two-component system chemotaxis sensor kinase CheA